MRIIVDAMGGDYAPGPQVEGSVRAAQELGVEIVLVGKQVVFTSSIDINHNLVYEGEHIKVFVLTRKIICKKIGVILRN